MLSRPRRTRFSRLQTGMTLVELIIGTVVGLVILAGVFSSYFTSIVASANMNRSARLNQDLRVAMDLMANDIRRAGYWIDPPEPPEPPISDIAISADGTSILVAYDANWQSATPQVVFGYRLNNGVVETLHDPAGAVKVTPGSGLGGLDVSAYWQPLTDAKETRVTGLSFSTSPSQCMNISVVPPKIWPSVINNNTPVRMPMCENTGATGYVAPTNGNVLVEMRGIRIQLVGQHAMDGDIEMELVQDVKVQNNRIFVFTSP